MSSEYWISTWKERARTKKFFFIEFQGIDAWMRLSWSFQVAPKASLLSQSSISRKIIKIQRKIRNREIKSVFTSTKKLSPFGKPGTPFGKPGTHFGRLTMRDFSHFWRFGDGIHKIFEAQECEACEQECKRIAWIARPAMALFYWISD